MDVLFVGVCYFCLGYVPFVGGVLFVGGCSCCWGGGVPFVGGVLFVGECSFCWGMLFLLGGVIFVGVLFLLGGGCYFGWRCSFCLGCCSFCLGCSFGWGCSFCWGILKNVLFVWDILFVGDVFQVPRLRIAGYGPGKAVISLLCHAISMSIFFVNESDLKYSV